MTHFAESAAAAATKCGKVLPQGPNSVGKRQIQSVVQVGEIGGQWRAVLNFT